jgi:uncharacterized coiled-coil protein SlyX
MLPEGVTFADLAIYITCAGVLISWILDKTLASLKARGLDPVEQANAITNMSNAITTMNASIQLTHDKLDAIQEKVDALHEVHLGPHALDADGRPKWWNREEVNDAIVETAHLLRENAGLLRDVRTGNEQTQLLIAQSLGQHSLHAIPTTHPHVPVEQPAPVSAKASKASTSKSKAGK